MARKKSNLSVVTRSDVAVTTQPSVRAYVHWTPSQIRAVTTLADNGDLSRLADLCDQIMGDERFAELLDKLASSVLGCELSFEENQRAVVGKAQRSVELEQDWATGWAEDELLQFIMWQQLLGVAFARHEHWVETETGRIVPRFRVWHPKHFTWDQRERTWKVRKTLPNGVGTGPLEPIRQGDGEWVIMTRRGDFRPWAHGLWRGLSRWWMLKQYAISDWGVHSEKGSKLLLLAPEGVSSSDRKALAQDVFAMSKDATISLPAGFSMQLIETSANTRDIYLAQIDAADMAAAIAILGQNLSSRVDGGSYAAAASHERGELRRQRYVAKSLGLTLWTQSLPWWAEYNFGDRRQAPYPRYNTDPPEDKGAKVQTLATLAQAIGALKQAGYTLTLEQIEEQYGVALEQTAPPVSDGAVGPASATPTLRDAHMLVQNEPRAAEPTAHQPPPAFVAGQQYADALAATGTERVSEELMAFTDRLIAAIDSATNHDEIAQAVLQAYAAAPDPAALAQLCENAMVMAELAGRYAVKQE